MRTCIIKIDGKTYQYMPVQPRADAAFSSEGKRLIFRHGSPTAPESHFIIAEPLVITAGWLLGIQVEEITIEHPHCEECNASHEPKDCPFLKSQQHGEPEWPNAYEDWQGNSDGSVGVD